MPEVSEIQTEMMLPKFISDCEAEGSMVKVGMVMGVAVQWFVWLDYSADRYIVMLEPESGPVNALVAWATSPHEVHIFPCEGDAGWFPAYRAAMEFAMAEMEKDSA